MGIMALVALACNERNMHALHFLLFPDLGMAFAAHIKWFLLCQCWEIREMRLVTLQAEVFLERSVLVRPLEESVLFMAINTERFMRFLCQRRICTPVGIMTGGTGACNERIVGSRRLLLRKESLLLVTALTDGDLLCIEKRCES